MTKYCDCGYELIHKKGSKNWACSNPDDSCTIWSKQYARNGDLIKVTRVAVPREIPLGHYIIGEM